MTGSIEEDILRQWGSRKISGYTGDPGQRGQRSSAIVKRKRWNKLLNNLNAIFSIPPGQQPGRPRPKPKPKSKPVPMPTPTYKKSGPGYA